MKKDAGKLRCTLLNGSAWEHREKDVRRYKGTFDIFFAMEHRLRKELEEQFNQEAQEGWRCAVNAARITDKNASSEDRKHTSGGVSVAVDINLIGEEEGAVKSIEETREESLRRGSTCEEVCAFSRCTSCTRKDPEE